MAVQISSASNDRMKHLVRLRDRRHRDADGLFVVEGDRLFSRAIAAGLEPQEIFVAPDHPMADDSRVVVVDPGVLDKVSYRRTSEGLVAIFRQFESSLADLERSDRTLLLAGESIEKPGNLGAMARTANAIGSDALLSIGSVIDVFNPNVLRASTGAIFETPVVTCSIKDLGEWLVHNEVRLVATSPDSRRTIWDADLSGPVAIAVGAEDAGHSDALLRLADEVVRIPMTGSVDSLNASTSLAVMAYEALRQRS
ncbi:MAG: RNA methyltransferase [Actinomycetota bacterium]|nr:RNA methyltransferase [Actinomycetota bacterium]